MTDKFESTDLEDSLDAESQSQEVAPFSQSSWLRIGLGALAALLILVLAGPAVRDWLSTTFRLSDSSLTELEQSAAADPHNEALQYELAGAYYRARHFTQAWNQFRAVERYGAVADVQPAIAEAEQAVQAAPSSKEAHFQLGTVWARNNLPIPAEIAFKQAIALDDQYADAHVNLGAVYYQTGRLPDALREYNAALEVNPNDADVHHNKAAVYIQQAIQSYPPDTVLLDAAQNEIELALEIEPDLPQAHFSQGVVYMVRGQNRDAIAQFQRFLGLDDGTDPEATAAAQSYLSQLGQ